MQAIPGIRPVLPSAVEATGPSPAQQSPAQTPGARIEGDWKLAQPSASARARSVPGAGRRDNIETATDVMRAMGAVASLAAAVTSWTDADESAPARPTGPATGVAAPQATGHAQVQIEQALPVISGMLFLDTLCGIRNVDLLEPNPGQGA